jgi:hypothetical protein
VTHPFDRLDAAAAPDDSFLAGGHLWRAEYPEGTPLRVRLTAQGMLELGVPADPGWPAAARGVDRWRRVAPGAVSPVLGFAARALRRRFDRAALRAATADAAQVAFDCVAVHRRRGDYDWERTPAVVGVDAAHPTVSFLPHERRQLIEGVGLAPAPTVRAETPASRVDPDGPLPASAWRDDPAFGVYSHKKPDGTALRLADETGFERAERIGDGAGGDDGAGDGRSGGDDGAGDDESTDTERARGDERVESPDATALASDWVTEERVRRARDRVDDPTVDRVGTAVFDRLVRARFPTVVGSGLDPAATRDAVVARVARTWDAG